MSGAHSERFESTPWSMYLVTLSMGRGPLRVALALGSIVSAAVTLVLMSIMLCSHQRAVLLSGVGGNLLQ